MNVVTNPKPVMSGARVDFVDAQLDLDVRAEDKPVPGAPGQEPLGEPAYAAHTAASSLYCGRSLWRRTSHIVKQPQLGDAPVRKRSWRETQTAATHVVSQNTRSFAGKGHESSPRPANCRSGHEALLPGQWPCPGTFPGPQQAPGYPRTQVTLAKPCREHSPLCVKADPCRRSK